MSRPSCPETCDNFGLVTLEFITSPSLRPAPGKSKLALQNLAPEYPYFVTLGVWGVVCFLNNLFWIVCLVSVLDHIASDIDTGKVR